MLAPVAYAVSAIRDIPSSLESAFRSRSHDATIRVCDEAGDVIETHEHAGDFKEMVTLRETKSRLVLKRDG